jgi:hypothetical protein
MEHLCIYIKTSYTRTCVYIYIYIVEKCYLIFLQMLIKKANFLFLFLLLHDEIIYQSIIQLNRVTGYQNT